MEQGSDEVKAALEELRLKNLETLVESLVRDRDNALRWGIIVLGTAVVSLITWIINLVANRHL